MTSAPNKHVFLVTSCMVTNFGIFSLEERFNQTIKTFDSIRDRVPDALIVFSDSSIHPHIPDEYKDVINNKVDLYYDFSIDQNAQMINSNMLKSVGECYLLYHTIKELLKTFDFTAQGGFMFKLGARCSLNEVFDVTDFTQYKDKFVFKKRLNTWRQDSLATHLLETRLYGWDYSLINEYMSVLEKNFVSFQNGLDTEHAHLLNIDPDKLIEIDTVNCACTIAASGQLMND